MTGTWQEELKRAQELYEEEKYQEIIDRLQDRYFLTANYQKAELLVERAKAYWKLGNNEKALDDLHRARVINKDYAPIYNYRGNVKTNLGQHEEAIQDYDKAIELNPEYAIAYYNRGLTKANLGQNIEAIKDYDKAIELNPVYANAYNNRGYLKKNLGQYEEAIRDYDKAIELNPELTSAYNNRGISKRNLGQYEEAIKDYDKAIELNPKNADVYYNRGITKANLGQYEEAIKDYDEAIALNPEYVSAYNNRGYTKRNLGQYEEAIKDYNKAIELNPEYAIAYNNRGIVKANLGQYIEAIKDYDKAIEHNPAYANPYNNRGNTKRILGQYEEAIKDYDEAIRLEPEGSLRYRNKGFALQKLNKNSDAIICYQKAISLNPRDYTAKQFLDELLLKQGQAIKAAGHTINKEDLFSLLINLTKDLSEDVALPIQSAAVNINNRVSQISDLVKAKNIYSKSGMVGHYTKIDVALKLLCSTINDEHQCNTASKLRYSNAAYMNDPSEGRIILDYWDEDSITDAFTNAELGEDSNIYIGSFVEVDYENPSSSHDDDLFLWRTYGKDLKGVEGTGCCLVFSHTFFDLPIDGRSSLNSEMSVSNSDDDGKLKTNTNAEKDIISEELKQCLYKVYYIAKKGDSISIIGDEGDAIKTELEELKKEILDLLELKNKEDKKDSRNYVIDKLVYHLLSEIRYFFKTADYQYENEYRVLLFAEMGSKFIKHEPRDEEGQHFYRLYIESNKDVASHIRKLVLGPKIANPDHYIYLSDLMAKAGKKLELRRSKTPFR